MNEEKKTKGHGDITRTKGAASPSGTCFAPRWPDLDVPQELCDRDSLHLGNHAAWSAAWRIGGRSRVYWPRAVDSGHE